MKLEERLRRHASYEISCLGIVGVWRKIGPRVIPSRIRVKDINSQIETGTLPPKKPPDEPAVFDRSEVQLKFFNIMTCGTAGIGVRDRHGRARGHTLHAHIVLARNVIDV